MILRYSHHDIMQYVTMCSVNMEKILARSYLRLKPTRKGIINSGLTLDNFTFHIPFHHSDFYSLSLWGAQYRSVRGCVCLYVRGGGAKRRYGNSEEKWCLTMHYPGILIASFVLEIDVVINCTIQFMKLICV